MSQPTDQVYAPPHAPWWYLYEYQLRVYRRVWRASVTTKLLTPVLFLLSMGVGLGSLVNAASGGIQVGDRTVPYLPFLVPGILAVTAMSTAMGESSWPVLSSIKWTEIYHGMLSGPAEPDDIITAHLVYVMTQSAAASAIFMAVAAPFNGFSSWSALGCLPVSVLIGLAFGSLVTALSVRMEDENGFNILFRLGQTPLMLFSGTFFPISQLPGWLQPLAWVTPLWHGVEANRTLSLGTGSLLALAGHLAALAGFAALGWILARRGLRRRLRP